MGSFGGRFLASWLLALVLATEATAATLSSPMEPIVTRMGYRYFRFPVAWELMRSGFNALDVALEAENYAEYWAILYLSADEIELITPRGRARVVGVSMDKETPLGYPDLLLVNEADFARLLGLEPDPLGSVEKVAVLELPVRDSNEQNFTLKASPKYFVSVQLTMSF